MNGGQRKGRRKRIRRRKRQKRQDDETMGLGWVDPAIYEYAEALRDIVRTLKFIHHFIASICLSLHVYEK